MAIVEELWISPDIGLRVGNWGWKMRIEEKLSIEDLKRLLEEVEKTEWRTIRRKKPQKEVVRY
jgi:hypothetical protein